MNRLMAITAAIVAISTQQGVLAQPKPSLRLSLGFPEYCGEVYAASPQIGGFVFFAGEPIRIAGMIGSRLPTEEASLITPAGSDGTNLFTSDFTYVSLPYSTRQQETTLPARLHWERAIIRHDNGFETSSDRLDPTTRLKPEVGLEFRAELDSRLQPGGYRLRIRMTNAKDAGGAEVSAGMVTFEIRERSVDTAAEELRRQACRAFLQENDSEAESLARKLLEVVPNSTGAYGVLLMVAQRRVAQARDSGDGGRALELARALQGLTEQQLAAVASDRLLQNHASPKAIQQLRENILRDLSSPAPR